MAKSKMKGVIQKGDYWYARINGREEYFGKGDKAKKMAEAAKAKEITQRYENKEARAGLKVKRAQFKNFKQMCNWYMTLPSIQSQTGYQRKVYAANKLLSYFGHRSIFIEVDDQELYRVHRLNEGVGHHTINFEIELLRAIYHMARRRKKIREECMPGEFVFEDYKNPRPLVDDESFKKMLESANDDFKDVLICGYESAMRSDEIANLTADQVHLDITHMSGQTFDYIDLGIFDTKNKTRRTVPVSARLKKVLKRRIEGKGRDDCVFDHNGLKFSKHKVKYYMQRTCKKAKVIYGDKVVNKRGEKIGIVFHSLRKTRITKWVEMGFSDEIIRRASGHKSLDAYREYVKLGPQSVMCLVENATKTLQNRSKAA